MVSLTKKQQAEKNEAAEQKAALERWLATKRAEAIRQKWKRRRDEIVYAGILIFQNAVYAIIAVWLVRHW